MLDSTLCRYEHFSEDWYARWSATLPLSVYGVDTSVPPEQPSRKAWEWCAIAQALAERGMLEAGRRGCGFAVGAEPLPSAFAARDVEILATDQAMTTEAQAWAETGQHAASLESLYRPELIDRPGFEARVGFRNVDMRDLRLPWDDSLGGAFDFIWSSCSFEHLGSLAAGLAFVVQAMQLVKPGGLAIHTTEFNVSSDESTLAEGDSVVYRRRDIEDLDRKLRAVGCGLSRCDFFSGDHPSDLDFDVPPFGTTGRPHVKLLLGGYVCTSILLIIRKGFHADTK